MSTTPKRSLRPHVIHMGPLFRTAPVLPSGPGSYPQVSPGATGFPVVTLLDSVLLHQLPNVTVSYSILFCFVSS